MKANTHSSTSGTIEPMPVSVSRIAPSPAQPGRPAFSTIRHAIQAARMVATSAKALVNPKKPIRAAISTPMLAPRRRGFAGSASR